MSRIHEQAKDPRKSLIRLQLQSGHDEAPTPEGSDSEVGVGAESILFGHLLYVIGDGVA
jgi:hypothetical protein